VPGERPGPRVARSATAVPESGGGSFMPIGIGDARGSCNTRLLNGYAVVVLRPEATNRASDPGRSAACVMCGGERHSRFLPSPQRLQVRRRTAVTMRGSWSGSAGRPCGRAARTDRRRLAHQTPSDQADRRHAELPPRDRRRPVRAARQLRPARRADQGLDIARVGPQRRVAPRPRDVRPDHRPVERRGRLVAEVTLHKSPPPSPRRPSRPAWPASARGRRPAGRRSARSARSFPATNRLTVAWSSPPAFATE
jgi:hypothetical protein